MSYITDEFRDHMRFALQRFDCTLSVSHIKNTRFHHEAEFHHEILRLEKNHKFQKYNRGELTVFSVQSENTFKRVLWNEEANFVQYDRVDVLSNVCVIGTETRTFIVPDSNFYRTGFNRIVKQQQSDCPYGGLCRLVISDIALSRYQRVCTRGRFEDGTRRLKPVAHLAT